MVNPINPATVYTLHELAIEQTHPGQQAPSALTPPGSVAISTFSRTIQEAADDFKQNQEEFDIFNELLSKGFFRGVIGNVSGLVARTEGLDEHLSEWASLLSTQGGQVDGQNTEINNYNSDVPTEQSETDALNTAITNYNNNPTPANEAALTTAVANYEAYRATRNGEITAYNGNVTNYNNDVATNNTTIADLNTVRPQYGLSDIPDQNTISTRDQLPPGPIGPPYTVPVSTLPPRTLIGTIPDVPEPPPVSSINTDITSINNDINAHNPGIENEQTEIQTLNDAINQFNDGLITAAQLQTAVNNYNSFKSGRDPQITSFNSSISTFNSNVPTYNATIDQINADRAVYGLPPVGNVSLQNQRALMPDAPTAPFVAPIDSLPSPLLAPTVELVSDAPVTEIYSEDVFSQTFTAGITSVGDFFLLIARAEDFIQRIKFILRRKPNELLLSAAITDQQKIWRNPPGESRAGYGIMAAGFFKEGVSRSLGTAVAEAELSRYEGLDPERVLGQFQSFNFQAQGRAAILGARSALAILAGSLGEVNLLPRIDPEGSVAGIALATGFLSQIRSVATAGVVSDAVEQFLSEEGTFQNLSTEQQTQLVQTLSASASLALALNGLTSLSIALGAQGIIPQILSTAVPSELSLLDPPEFADILQNRLNIIQFEEQILNALALASGTGRVTASLRAFVSENLAAAFEALPQRPTAEQFLEVLTRQFERAGARDVDDIRRLLFNSLLFLVEQLPDARFSGASLDASLLSGAINKDVLRRAGLSEEVAAAVLGDLRRPLLQENILKEINLREINLRNAIRRDEITRDIIRRDTNLAELRRSVIRNLDRNGVAVDSAISEANQVIDSIRRDLETASINQSALQDAIVDDLIEKGIAEEEAAERSREALERLRSSSAETLQSDAAIRRQLAEAGVSENIPLPRIEEPDLATFFPGVLEGASQDEARRLLKDRVETLLTQEIDQKSAQQISDALARIVLDDERSIINVVKENLGILQKREDRKLNEALGDSFREAMDVNIDVYKFNVEEIMQPGKELVRVGIMYTNDQPDNYINYTEFQV